ncbi:MAG: hypothetical protein HC836_24340 [Richelia sp. RM2_1_2]|nr:hypothetical protein [Richelia sp. RM2_1_2]
MFRICYVDLNAGDFQEDYSYSPQRYGGGRVLAAALLKNLPQVPDSSRPSFHLYARKKALENVQVQDLPQCFELSQNSQNLIRSGDFLKNHIDEDNYDIFVSHDPCIWLNTDKLQATWPIGYREKVHPKHKHVIMFDRVGQESDLPKYCFVYDAVIGPPAPIFKEYIKKDYIFQCSRHLDVFQSIEIAKLCINNKIKCYFAGPIEDGYNLLEFIDNKNTFYLGVIDQETKIKYLQGALFFTQLQTYPIAATLAGKEALLYGVPLLTTPIGGWMRLIHHGINGYFIKNENDFLNAWNNKDCILQKNCYLSCLDHTEEKMIDSFLKAFERILES